MQNKIHQANRKRWELGAKLWAKSVDSRGIWNKCHKKPELVLCKKELEYLGNVKNKKICVLGSGDNQVVFALAGLGAQVTSVDISQNQLDIAKERAKKLHLAIKFVQADVINLSKLKNGSFDIVYTGGHVAVWVSDLKKYYLEAVRILKVKGLFIVNEYHPFRRIWKESKNSLVVETPYTIRGPFKFNASEDILYYKPGSLDTYEFHWTISDYINAIVGSGCNIMFCDEYGNQVGSWEGAPLKGIPEFLLLIAQKK